MSAFSQHPSYFSVRRTLPSAEASDTMSAIKALKLVQKNLGGATFAKAFSTPICMHSKIAV
jgi:hypothetical protein